MAASRISALDGRGTTFALLHGACRVDAALVASLGATFIMPTLEDNVVFRPFPTFGVAFETSLGRGGHLGLRAGVSYIHSVYGTRSGGFLAPTLALTSK